MYLLSAAASVIFTPYSIMNAIASICTATMFIKHNRFGRKFERQNRGQILNQCGRKFYWSGEITILFSALTAKAWLPGCVVNQLGDAI